MKREKIFVHLERDKDGYPPFDVESIWAIRTEGGYKVDNIPFYARVVALGDLVAVEEEADVLWYRRTIQASPNSLIRVVAYSGVGLDALRADLEGLGCATEADAKRHLVAVNVPAAVPIDEVLRYLAGRQRQGSLDYEEAILRRP